MWIKVTESPCVCMNTHSVQTGTNTGTNLVSLAVWKWYLEVILSRTIRQYIVLRICWEQTSASSEMRPMGSMLPYGEMGAGAGGTRVKSPRSIFRFQRID